MLEKQLTQLLEDTRALDKVIEDETLCLKEKSFDTLNELLANKQKLLQRINATDKKISSEENITLIRENEALTSLRSEIESLLANCKKNNEINGKLVEMGMNSNKHLMQILTQAKGKNSVTYDQKGVLSSASLLGKDIKA